MLAVRITTLKKIFVTSNYHNYLSKYVNKDFIVFMRVTTFSILTYLHEPIKNINKIQVKLYPLMHSTLQFQQES